MNEISSSYINALVNSPAMVYGLYGLDALFSGWELTRPKIPCRIYICSTKPDQKAEVCRGSSGEAALCDLCARHHTPREINKSTLYKEFSPFPLTLLPISPRLPVFSPLPVQCVYSGYCVCM